MTDKPLETVLKGVRAILLGNGGSKALLVAFELLAAGYLGASAFGHYALALAIAQVGATVCMCGFNFGVIQRVALYQEEGRDFEKANVIFVAIAAVALVATIFGAALFSSAQFLALEVFKKPELSFALKLAAPLLVLEALTQILSAVFRGLRQFVDNVITYDLLRNIFVFMVFPVFVVFDAKAGALMALQSAGAVIGLGYGFLRLWRQGILHVPARVDKEVFAKLWSFSRPLFLWNFLQVLAVRFFILAAGVFLTSAETGILAVASRLALAFIFFQTAAGSTVQAEFARFHHLRDLAGLRRLYQAITQGLLGVVVAVALFLLVNTPHVLSYVGAEYAAYGWMIWPLLVAHLLNVVTGPAGQLLMGTERQATLMRLTFVDVALQFLMVIPLMFFHGVAGAIAGETLRVVLFVFLRLWIIAVRCQVGFAGRSYWQIAILFLVALILGLALTFSGAHYFVALPAGFIIYAAGMAAIIMRDKEIQKEIRVLLTFRRRPV